MVWAPMWLPASLLCLSTLLAYTYCKEVVGIVGENFTFPVQIDQKIVEIVWKKNKDKVVEWEEQKKPTYFDALRDRSVLMEKGSLTIVNLQKNDADIYELLYWDSVKDHHLNFQLVVLDSLPKPEISCNTINDELVLNCTANFQWSLNYTWKLSNSPHSHQNQELSIPLKNIDITTNATCIIKFSQTERSSEISLSQCLPEEKGERSHKRNRNVLFVLSAVILVGIPAVILVLCYRKGKLGTRRTAENNSPVNGSGEDEQLFYRNNHQPSDSEGDRTLNENNRALKEKQIVKNGVNQEEVTQDTEDGNGEHPDSSSSCTKEDPTT